MEPSYSCDLCEANFDSEEKLSEHLKVHLGPAQNQ